MDQEGRVLVVGDGHDGDELTARLETAGMAVTRASDGDDATDHLDAAECVLSILDPETSLSALRSVRSSHPDVPFVLVVSGRDVVSEAIQAGATDYVLAGGNDDWHERAVERVELLVDRGRRGHGLQTEDREWALETLHSATRELMAAESTEAVLEAGITAAESILGLDIATFHLGDEGVLRPVVSTDRTTDLLDEIPEFEAGSGIAWEVYETGEATVTDDVRRHADVRNPETPFRSELILPVGDHGVFLASSVEVGAFDEASEFLAKVLVANVEAALDRAEREALLRRRSNVLEALHDATRELLTADSRQEVADILTTTAEEVLGLPLSAVWLYDEEEDALLPVSYPDDDDVPGEPPVYRRGSSLSWRAFETGEIRSFEDVADVDGIYNEETAIRSEIVVPIGDHGVMNAGATTTATFDEDDRRLAGLLAAAGASALDRVERDEERAAQRRELERQNERLEQFASFVSHDLRNPLTIAQGHLEMAREDPSADHFDAVAEALDRMHELTEDVLTLAREGQTAAEVGQLSLEAAVRAAWETVGAENATLEVDDDLGRIRGDEGPVVQLFENLLGNAIEHGGEDVTVRVDRLADGFAVADDGSGIPDDDRQDVFDAGYSTAERGTGFGLAIVEEIVTSHGWTVRVVESEAGGARFEFSGVTFLA